MEEISKSKLYLVFSLLVSISIFFFSIVPETGPTKPSGPPLHFIAYFILAGSLIFYFQSKNKTVIAVPAIAGLYGIGIETIQFFIPYRHFEILDIFINFIGALTFLAIYYFCNRFS